MKVSITREYNWEMGHALMNHKGKCYNPHGHNYRMEVEVRGDIDDVSGMVIDFGELDEIIKPLIENIYDHKFYVNGNDPRFQGQDYARQLGSFKKGENGWEARYWEPTAENLALDLHFVIESTLPEGQILESVTLYETDKSKATIRSS
tara:strand:- start:6052 stop:6495 length:444 start_codon:yes stop_codon:yes gene_type:complete